MECEQNRTEWNRKGTQEKGKYTYNRMIVEYNGMEHNTAQQNRTEALHDTTEQNRT